MNEALIAICVSVGIIAFIAIFYIIRAIVKKCKKDNSEIFLTRKRDVETADNIHKIQDDYSYSSETSIEENNQNSPSIDTQKTKEEESTEEKTDISLSNTPPASSTTGSTIEIESSETTENNTPIINRYNYNNYNYHYHYSSSYEKDSGSSDKYRRNSSDDKSFSFHNYRRESEHYTSNDNKKSSSSTRMAKCCNKCRNTCAKCHSDAGKSALRAYLCSDCMRKYGNLDCPVCENRRIGEDQARLCNKCGSKYGNKCFDCG